MFRLKFDFSSDEVASNLNDLKRPDISSNCELDTLLYALLQSLSNAIGPNP